MKHLVTVKVTTFQATIYVGCKERCSGIVRDISYAYRALQTEADKGGLCVSVLPLEFIYKDGREPGLAIGLINYPRFPESEAAIKSRALSLAHILKLEYKQLRVTVVFPDETIMLDDDARCGVIE